MDIFKLPFLVILFSSLVHCKPCPTSYCPNNTFPIQYPFKLQSQNTQNCTYINLTCTAQGTTILNLPNSGDFYVRYIYYRYPMIQLYDPGNCLPKRLMSLNSSSFDPLLATNYRNYTFYSCPSNIVHLANLTAIDCLSNSSVSIVATHTVSSEVMTKLYQCSEIVTSSIPVPMVGLYDFIGNQSDFLLYWTAPSSSCDCAYMIRNTGLVPDYIVQVTFIMISFVAVIMPSVICIGCCFHFTRMFRQEAATKTPQI